MGFGFDRGTFPFIYARNGDMRYLPYLYGGKYGPAYSSFGWHIICLFGIDWSIQEALVSDTAMPGLQRITLKDLHKPPDRQSPAYVSRRRHIGPYDCLGSSYRQLFEARSEGNLQALLPSRELYLKGPGMILPRKPEKYITEIQVQVLE